MQLNNHSTAFIVLSLKWPRGELHYFSGPVLCGEKSCSSALSVGSVRPSPYRPFQSLGYPRNGLRLDLTSLSLRDSSQLHYATPSSVHDFKYSFVMYKTFGTGHYIDFILHGK